MRKILLVNHREPQEHRIHHRRRKTFERVRNPKSKRKIISTTNDRAERDQEAVFVGQPQNAVISAEIENSIKSLAFVFLSIDGSLVLHSALDSLLIST